MKSSFINLGVLTAVSLLPVAAHAQNRQMATDNTNIAAAANGGRILSVTSTLENDKAYSASNLIDGQTYNPATGAGSKGWASNQYDPINMDSVTIGFANNSTHKIGKIVLNPTIDLTTERWAKDIEVQVSTTSAEGPYTAVAQLSLKRQAAPQEFPMLPVDARFVRLMFRSNWGSDRAVGLGEVEIYEAIDGSDAMGGLITRFEGALNDLRRYRQVQVEGGGAPAVAAPKPQPGAGNAAPSNPNRNIAAAKNGGKIMGSSSTYNNDPDYGPEKLIDGQNYSNADNSGSNGWASQGFEPGKEFVTIGFADDRIKLIGKVRLNPISNQSDLRWARRVEVQVTSESYANGPWKTAATINLRPEGVPQDFDIRPVEAKYVRFVFLANGPGVVLPNADPNVNSDRSVSLGEIEVYEAVTGGDQLELIVKRLESVLTDFKTLRHRDLNDPAPAPADDAPATPAPVSTRKPANGKTGPTTVKSAPVPAKKNVEEALISNPRGKREG